MNAYTFLMYFNLFWRARSDPWRAFQVFRMRKSSSWALLARVYVVVYGHGALEESLSSSCSNCERQTKYSCITCGKSVCVLLECSIPEVKGAFWFKTRTIVTKTFKIHKKIQYLA